MTYGSRPGDRCTRLGDRRQHGGHSRDADPPGSGLSSHGLRKKKHINIKKSGIFSPRWWGDKPASHLGEDEAEGLPYLYQHKF